MAVEVAAPRRGEPDAHGLAALQALYDDGRYLSAHAVLGRYADPLRWTSPHALVLAARLVRNLGGATTAQALILRAWRRGRPDPEVAYYHGLELAERHGPLRAWEHLRELRDAEAPLARANLCLARAQVLTLLRDFAAAGAELDAAEALVPEHLFGMIDRAAWLAAQDRTEDALAVARQALARRAHYRPAVQIASRLLEELGRRDEAYAVLDDAARHLESFAVVLQRGALEREAGRHADAWRSYQEAARLMPCIDEPTFRGLSSLCSAAAYQCGDIDAAVRFARAARTPLLDKLAGRLAAAGATGGGARVALAVPFVRQDHKTCGPATLASIARFHDVPAAHVDIVEAICFDGTSAASERGWAEEQGFAVRELTVTWDAATALLDAGLPFTLHTQQATSAHLQAIIGYDARWRSFLVRDPSNPALLEMDVETLLEAQAWVGPRAMVLAPAARAAALEGISLPDAELYDRAYDLERALRGHDYAAATAVLADLERRAPDHHVTALAAQALANYDGDPVRLLAALETQLARHPAATPLKLRKLSCLRGLAHARERVALLEELTAAPDADPLFGRMLAEELLEDERQSERVERLLRRALRARPLDGGEYFALAWLMLARRRFDDARMLFRFAACLDDAHDAAAFSYFSSCRQVGRTEEALAFLRERFERRGRRFSEPARTLHECLEVLGRTGEAIAVLDQALAARPDDEELRLYVAVALARRGRQQRARELLEAARAQAKPTSWARAAAAIDILDGDLGRARARHEEILEAEPLALDAHHERLRLVAALEGRAAAQAAAEAAAARFPNHRGLARLRVDWTEDDGEMGLDALRNLIAVAPDDAWAHRELALRLGERNRFAEAEAALAEAAARDPSSASTWAVRGLLAEWQGRRAEAAEAHRAALRVDIDHISSLRALLALAGTPEERRRELAFVRDELRRQVSFGDGLASYRKAAQVDEPAAATLAFLEEARGARPDLRTAWTAVVFQLLDAGLVPEARRVATEACERFPLRPEPYLALASVCQIARDDDAERAALEEAVALSSESTQAVELLAQRHRRGGDLAQARDLLARAAARAPLEVGLHGTLAQVLWDLGDADAALARLELALRLDAGYARAWERLDELSARAGQRERALRFARELTRERPASSWAHFGLAVLLAIDRDFDERLAALDAALRQAPRFVDAYEERAFMLSEAGRFDEALAACSPAPFAERPPVTLRGRAAWIEWQRGDSERALARITAVLADEPDYVFGWVCLASWRLARGERAPAKEAYRKAVELDPGNSRGGLVLFDLEIADGELDAAETTLERLRRVLPPARTRMPALRLLGARRQPAAAFKLLDELAAEPDAGPAALDEAAESLVEAGWSSRLASHLEGAIARPDAPAPLGYLWARRSFARPVASWWRALRRLRAAGAIGRFAMLGYIERSAGEGSGLALRAFVALHARALHADGELWGATGYAFAARRWTRSAARWLRAWRDVDGVQPWMLLNATLAFRRRGWDAEAHEVSLAALSMPSDGGVARHRRWLALDAALAAPLEEARRAVAAAPPAADDLDGFILATARAALAARDPRLPADLRPRLTRAVLTEAAERARRVRLLDLARRLRRKVSRLRP